MEACMCAAVIPLYKRVTIAIHLLAPFWNSSASPTLPPNHKGAPVRTDGQLFYGQIKLPSFSGCDRSTERATECPCKGYLMILIGILHFGMTKSLFLESMR